MSIVTQGIGAHVLLVTQGLGPWSDVGLLRYVTAEIATDADLTASVVQAALVNADVQAGATLAAQPLQVQSLTLDILAAAHLDVSPLALTLIAAALQGEAHLSAESVAFAYASADVEARARVAAAVRQIQKLASDILAGATFDAAPSQLQILAAQVLAQAELAAEVTAFGDPLTPLDERLVPAVLDIIDRLGKAVTFHYIATRDYDPSTGTVSESAPVLHIRKAVLDSFRRRHTRRGLVRTGRVLLYVAAKDLPIDPEMGMAVTFDDTHWRIEAVKQVTSGVATALYILRLVGDGVIVGGAVYTALDERLVPRVLSIVQRLGKAVTFTVNTSYAYDPSTGHTTISTIAHTRRTTPPARLDAYADGDAVRKGDVEVFVPADGLPFTPERGQLLGFGDRLWTVVEVRPIYSGAQVALWGVQGRQ